jgi:hypothetical protein
MGYSFNYTHKKNKFSEKIKNIEKKNFSLHTSKFKKYNENFLYFHISNKFFFSYNKKYLKIEDFYNKNKKLKINKNFEERLIHTILYNKLESSNFIWGFFKLNKDNKDNKIYKNHENKNLSKDLFINIFSKKLNKSKKNIKEIIGDKYIGYFMDYNIKYKKNNLKVETYRLYSNFNFNLEKIKINIEKKKQHYIQDSIIKNFKGNDYSYINLFNQNKLNCENIKKISDNFQKEFLYDINYKNWTQGIEERISLEKEQISYFENKFSDIYNKQILLKNKIDRKKQDDLVYYLMLQIFRTPTTNFIQSFDNNLLNSYYSRFLIDKINSFEIKNLNIFLIDKIIKNFEKKYFLINIEEHHKFLIKNIILKKINNTYKKNFLKQIFDILNKNEDHKNLFNFHNLEIEILENDNNNNNLSSLTPITELINNKFLYYIIPLSKKHSIFYYTKNEKYIIFKKLNIPNPTQINRYRKISKNCSKTINKLNYNILNSIKINEKKIIEKDN